MMQNIYTYLWLRLPLILMFANGYLIYRLLVVTKLTETFVFRSVRKSRGNLNCLLLYITAAATLLSFFIPNAVTVLILLPILKNTDQDIRLQTGGCSLATALTLSVVYGANIGGMGSLIGSPANLLLIGALDLYEAPYREQISFFNWFVWSVPLVFFFATAALALIILLAVPKQARGIIVRLKQTDDDAYRLLPAQKSGLFLFIIFLAFWILEAVIKEFAPVSESSESLVCICFFFVFCFFLFIRSPDFNRSESLGNSLLKGMQDVISSTCTRGIFDLLNLNGEPLLRPKDIITDIPRRGILFLCVLALIIPLFRVFRLDTRAADLIPVFIHPDTSLFFIIFLITLAVIFLTELLSNTVVSTAFFPIAYYISADQNISPLILMTGVSIASTCAFMSPVATPCNALAFGEMKGVSFRCMLVSGLVLNIIGAFMMTVWLRFIIPLVYY